MGEGQGLPRRLERDDEDCFPNLYRTGYRVTSPKDTAYDCIAYAMGDESRVWSPMEFPRPGYYWPDGASRENGPDGLRDCFRLFGYEPCSDGNLEDGYEKIAIYADDDFQWTHAAKQEQNGEWSSKLGSIEDIRHRTPHCFGGSIYGDVIYFMRRKIAREFSEEANTQTGTDEGRTPESPHQPAVDDQ